MSWIQARLDSLEYTHKDLQNALEELGVIRVRATITGWTNGKPIKLLSDPDDTKKLAKALKWSVIEMLIAAGYDLEIPEELGYFIHEYKTADQKRKIIYQKNISFVTSFANELDDEDLDISITNL